MQINKVKSVKRNVLALAVPLVLIGCASSYPKPDTSTQERISNEMSRASAKPQAREAAAPAPAAAAVPASVLDAMVLPQLSSSRPRGDVRGSAAQRFDLVVTDAPMQQVLASLVEGTEYSILLKPAAIVPTASAGGEAAPAAAEAPVQRVTFKLKNITLFDALDAIRDVYGYDYTVDNRRIIVQPAELQSRLFYVNYILGQRRGVSDLQVIAGASVSAGSSSSSSSTGTSNFGSVQASGVTTTVKTDVWQEAEDALRTLMGCHIPKTVATVTGATAARPAAGGNASRADVTLPGEVILGERLRGVDGCTEGRALSINPMSGTILVRGMPTELRMVERLLKSMQLSISRQVVIESKIIDVELNKDSQQGINWSQFRDGLHRASVGANPAGLGVNQPAATAGLSGGTVSSSQTLATLLGSGSSIQSAIGNAGGIAIQAANFSALINFLESQGRVNVLSSPRISTMNNQKAVIKVGSEEPFVTNIVGGTSQIGTTSTVVTQPTLTYQPFFSGIALDVTPQIDADDNITLHVHSLVNRVIEKAKTAQPGTNSTVPFAVNTMNQTDSVVKARDGQVVVIGGLMSERSSDTRGGVPGVREVPVAGSLFNFGQQSSSKRELVILLKTTVVKDDSTWTNVLGETEERIRTLQGR